MRLSYSALDTFNNCPAKYKYQYLEKIRAPKSKEAVFGTLIHDCLKLLHDPSKSVPLSQDELLKHFADNWNSNVYGNEQEEAFAFHQGVEILKNYYQQNQTKPFNIVDLEVPFSIDLEDDSRDQHQITGRIDRIDKLENQDFEIIDYKTSRKMPSQESLDNNLQLSVYHMGLVKRWPELFKENRQIKLSLYFLRHGEKISTVLGGQSIKNNQERITEIIEEIKTSAFEPRPGPLCGWCEYQERCPLFRHKFISHDSPAPDDLEIKDVADQLLEAKKEEKNNQQKIAELKDSINKYLDKKGMERVFGYSGYITRSLQKRRSYDFDKIKEILDPLDKWKELLTIDKTKLNKVLVSLPLKTRKEIEKKAKKEEKVFKVINTTPDKQINKQKNEYEETD